LSPEHSKQKFETECIEKNPQNRKMMNFEMNGGPNEISISNSR